MTCPVTAGHRVPVWQLDMKQTDTRVSCTGHRPLTGTVLEMHLGTTILAKAVLLEFVGQRVQTIP